MSEHTTPTTATSAPGTDVQPRIRPGAKALVRSPDGVLLVRERHADGSPFWTLPGGGVRPGETAGEGLRRELREELDCRCLVGERVAEFWYCHSSLRNTVSAYQVFGCHLLSEPTPIRAEGVDDVRWVPPADPPTGTICGVRALLGDDRPVDRGYTGGGNG